MQPIWPVVPGITTRIQRFSRTLDEASKPTLKAFRSLKRIRWRTHDNRGHALPLTFVKCRPTTLTADLNDNYRENTVSFKEPPTMDAAGYNDEPTMLDATMSQR